MIKKPYIHQYIKHLNSSNYKQRSKARKVASMRSFLSFLEDEEIISENLSDNFKIPTSAFISPNVLSEKEVEKIKNELQIKWKDLFNNYFYIAESRKSSKKFIHVVEINHYLKEKIKLNFNNFGIDIKGLIPLSSVMLAQANTTQYRVVKSLKNYFIFNYSRKGFSFFKANFFFSTSLNNLPVDFFKLGII